MINSIYSHFKLDLKRDSLVIYQLISLSSLIYFQGTEVKAITYSNMQVHDEDNKHEVYVIIDI